MFRPDRLIEKRKKNGLTQEQLGKKVNVTKAAISNYENGHSAPPPQTLVALSEVLYTTTDYLLGKDEFTYPLTPEIVKTVADDAGKYSADETFKLLEEEAVKRGLTIHDPAFKELLLKAFNLIDAARRDNSN